MTKHLIAGVLATIGLAGPAQADTPDRATPFTPRGDPASDQYTNPSGNQGNQGNSPPGNSPPGNSPPGNSPPGNSGRPDRGVRGSGDSRGARDDDGAGSGPADRSCSRRTYSSRQQGAPPCPTGPIAVATPSTPSTLAESGTDGGLPFTGGDIGTIVGIALALLAAGALARAASRGPLSRRS